MRDSCVDWKGMATKAELVWGFVEVRAGADPSFHGDDRCPKLAPGARRSNWMRYSDTPPFAKPGGVLVVALCEECFPNPLPRIRPKRTRHREEWEAPFIRSAGLPGLGKRS